jgi:hypothetical protein
VIGNAYGQGRTPNDPLQRMASRTAAERRYVSLEIELNSPTNQSYAHSTGFIFRVSPLAWPVVVQTGMISEWTKRHAGFGCNEEFCAIPTSP